MFKCASIFVFRSCHLWKKKNPLRIKRNLYLFVINTGGFYYMIQSSVVNNLRIGKCYFLRNLGENTSFMVLDKVSEDDFRIKDLLSMETYLFSKLIKYGIGKDFELNEIDC